ncbi:TrmH family RNA methyltransferase [Curtobacterium sp. MCJR17_043]|nr:TrmH family RNA methyltransferase [Curtobacterium sp. MCJR17_043]WIB35884.1 TrmH family RNA methyltransferase [Curtobacterium sp. MCJR17_043]
MPEPEVLTDQSDPAVQRLADLAKPARGAVRTAIVEDLEPLVQALRAGVRFVEVYGDSIREFPADLAALCTEHGVPVRLVDPAVLTKVFRSEKRPKVFGVANVPAPARFSALAEGTGDVLVLDGVKIVGNIGAIVRTAVGLGARGVVLVDSDLPTIADRRVVRASRGHVFSVPVLLETRERVARWLGESGLRVVDVDMDGSLSPRVARGPRGGRRPAARRREDRGVGRPAGPRDADGVGADRQPGGVAQRLRRRRHRALRPLPSTSLTRRHAGRPGSHSGNRGVLRGMSVASGVSPRGSGGTNHGGNTATRGDGPPCSAKTAFTCCRTRSFGTPTSATDDSGTCGPASSSTPCMDGSVMSVRRRRFVAASGPTAKRTSGSSASVSARITDAPNAVVGTTRTTNSVARVRLAASDQRSSSAPERSSSHRRASGESVKGTCPATLEPSGASAAPRASRVAAELTSTEGVARSAARIAPSARIEARLSTCVTWCARSAAKSRVAGNVGSTAFPLAFVGADRNDVVTRVRRGVGVLVMVSGSRCRGEQMSQSSMGKPWMHSSVTTDGSFRASWGGRARRPTLRHPGTAGDRSRHCR